MKPADYLSPDGSLTLTAAEIAMIRSLGLGITHEIRTTLKGREATALLGKLLLLGVLGGADVKRSPVP